jgi:hypothetical protein
MYGYLANNEDGVKMSRYGESSFQAFAERELRGYLEENDRKMTSHIRQESENYILNVNETEYLNYIVSQFSIDMLRIEFEGGFGTIYEKQVPAEFFPNGFHVTPGKSYSIQAYVYHLPYSGNVDLLKCDTNNPIIWTKDVFIKDHYICFEEVSFHGLEEIKPRIQNVIDNLKAQLDYLNQEIETYNNTQLRISVERAVSARKQKYLDQSHNLASLGLPIKMQEDLPRTYSIPTPLKTRKSVNTRPSVTTSGSSPDPTLDQSNYRMILQTIHDVGKVFERLPSTYRGKSEEELRDHFLLNLEPRTEGSATGETFNKAGKTDILIRHENSNVFIAECKFWEGPKHYLATITQLLGYLAWRDSKAAIVIFVRNKDFSSVLRAVKETTPDHLNYLGFVNIHDESWFNYRFHITNDRNREVKLAVILFHIPDLQRA